MATSLKQLSSKKLKALLETADEETRVRIHEILSKREQLAAKSNSSEHAVPETQGLTPEEEAAIAAAEANDGINPMYQGKKESAKEAISDEEFSANVEAARANINHVVEVVPFGMAEWLKGVIIGVMAEKRSKKPLYRVRLDNGKVINKAYDSNLLKVTDEVVESEKKECAPRAAGSVVTKNKGITEEELQARIAEAKKNVGRTIHFAKNGEPIHGRICGIQTDRRTNIVMYRISTGDKMYNKVYDSTAVTIDEQLDEEGLKMNEKALAEKKPAKAMTAEEIKERIAEIQATIEKGQKRIAELEAQLAAIGAELAESAESTESEAIGAELAESAESTESKATCEVTCEVTCEATCEETLEDLA
jgi:hypothetical protein